jgi:hypothetical protein
LVQELSLVKLRLRLLFPDLPFTELKLGLLCLLHCLGLLLHGLCAGQGYLGTTDWSLRTEALHCGL